MSRNIFGGGSHLKRVSITIQYKSDLETIIPGYALSHEILPKQLSFFAPQKFPVDEELIVLFNLNGEKKSITVKMNHMHEQISSGRIMNALPSESNPFPARKFYRCYTSVVNAVEATKTNTQENENSSVTADAVSATNNNAMDAFVVEAPASAEVPVVGDVAPVELPAEEAKAA